MNRLYLLHLSCWCVSLNAVIRQAKQHFHVSCWFIGKCSGCQPIHLNRRQSICFGKLVNVVWEVAGLIISVLFVWTEALGLTDRLYQEHNLTDKPTKQTPLAAPPPLPLPPQPYLLHRETVTMSPPFYINNNMSAVALKYRLFSERGRWVYTAHCWQNLSCINLAVHCACVREGYITRPGE